MEIPHQQTSSVVRAAKRASIRLELKPMKPLTVSDEHVQAVSGGRIAKLDRVIWGSDGEGPAVGR